MSSESAEVGAIARALEALAALAPADRPANPWARWLARPGRVPAAVLVPLLRGGADGLELLLTERAAHLPSHKGQISFPGGKLEPGEDATAAALRESAEEVGLRPDAARVIGLLDRVPTVASAFVITPVVAEVAADFPFAPEPGEVARLLRLPWAGFRDPAAFRTERLNLAGEQVDVPFFDVAGEVVWGATARVIRALLDTVAALG